MYNELLGIVIFFVTFIVVALMYCCLGKQGLIAWVAIGIITANIQVIKAVDIFGIPIALGNVMLVFIHLATDILNGIYGRRVAKRVVWLGLLPIFVTITVVQMSLHFIPTPEDISQKALSMIFGLVLRIALGSVIAYVIEQHVDMFVFSMIKKVFQSNKTFIARVYGSTVLSSIIDAALFVAIAFIGTLPANVVFEVFTTMYALKLVSTIFNVSFGYIVKSFYRNGKIQKLDEGY